MARPSQGSCSTPDAHTARPPPGARKQDSVIRHPKGTIPGNRGDTAEDGVESHTSAQREHLCRQPDDASQLQEFQLCHRIISGAPTVDTNSIPHLSVPPLFRAWCTDSRPEHRRSRVGLPVLCTLDSCVPALACAPPSPRIHQLTPVLGCVQLVACPARGLRFPAGAS